MTTSPQQVTKLLVDWSNGNQEALEQLTPLVYGELRRLAGRYLRKERPIIPCRALLSYMRPTYG